MTCEKRIKKYPPGLEEPMDIPEPEEPIYPPEAEPPIDPSPIDSSDEEPPF